MKLKMVTMLPPLVSVKMITYNHAPYIARAIKSVLTQKVNFPFELVIGEDCSTDGTREIVFDYAKKFPKIIRVITSDGNVGMKKNSRRTTEACRGKYIAYCEGDDYWHREDKLQIQADYLEEHPECGLVHSDQDRFFISTGKKIKSFFRTTNNIPPSNFNVFRGWGSWHILTCTVMARTKDVQLITLDPFIYHNDQNLGATDVSLFIEISMKAKIHYIDESLATYTVHKESASNSEDLKKKSHFVKSNLQTYLYLADKYGAVEEATYFKQRLYGANMWLAFWEKNPELARKFINNNPSNSLKFLILYFGTINPVISFFLHKPIATYIKIRNRLNFSFLSSFEKP